MHSAGGGGLNWFYVREGRRVGPFDRAPFIAQLLSLDAPEAVLVWHTGLAAWTKAGVLDELRGELPPPVPQALLGPDGPLEPPASDPVAPEASLDAALPPLPSEVPMSDGDFAGDLGPDSAASEEDATDPGENDAEGRRRRRRRHRPSRPSRVPSYLLPAVLLFVAVILGLWFLLRRMNEVPPGQILHQGTLTPTGGPSSGPALEPTGSLPGANPA